eukprot:790026-Rhodomonas_salina.1
MLHLHALVWESLQAASGQADFWDALFPEHDPLKWNGFYYGIWVYDTRAREYENLGFHRAWHLVRTRLQALPAGLELHVLPYKGFRLDKGRKNVLTAKNKGEWFAATTDVAGRVRAPQAALIPVSYTHLTLPTICSV